MDINSNGTEQPDKSGTNGSGSSGLKGGASRIGATASIVTTTTMKESSETTREVPVRWVVLFTGSTATADYEPTGSTGERPDLVEEVARMCVAFHPHNDIRLFPRDRAVTLFWRTQTTGDFVVTRVTTAPNPNGTRTALEYVNLLFDTENFARLGNDPFRTHALDLHGKVRDAFLGNRREALATSVPASAGRSASPAAGSVNLPTNDSVATPENVHAIEDYCARLDAEGGKLPPTFATWWASRGWVPPNYFDIVLRAAVPQAMTLREATDAAVSLASDTKAALPRSSGDDTVVASLLASILMTSDVLIDTISAAAERVNTEGPDEFRERLSDASRKASQIGNDLTSLVRRLPDGDSATDTRLAELSARFTGLSQEILKIRHPNPFGARRVPPTERLSKAAIAAAAAATPVTPPPVVTPPPSLDPASPKPNPFGQNGARTPSTGATQTTMPAKKGNPALVPGVIAAVAIVGFGIWKFAPHSAPAPTTGQHPTGGGTSSSSKPPHHSTSTAPVAATVTPAALIKRYSDEVQPVASAKARAAATEQATSNGGKKLGESDLEGITMKSIQAAYKETLPSADYAKAFAGSDNWDYSHYKEAFSSIVPSVRQAASSGATEAIALIEQQRKAVQAAAPTPAPPRATPEPAPTPRVVERHHATDEASATTHHTTKPRGGDNGGGGGEEHHPKATPHPATTSGGSSTGSAENSGL